MLLSIDDTHNRLHKSWIQPLNSRELNQPFVQQLTALIAFSLCGTSWWEERLKLVQRIPAALLSHSLKTYCLSLNSSNLDEWHKPPGMCLVRCCGAGSLLATISQDGWLRSQQIKIKPGTACWGPRSYRLTETEESLLFQHWSHVYLARPLSHPLTLSTPAENTPWRTGLSASALFPTLLLQFVPWHTGPKRLTAFHSLGKTINPHALASSQSNPQLPQ